MPLFSPASCRALVMSAVLALAGVALAQEPAPAIDPCTLLTRADAEAVVGPVKGAPRPESADRARYCDFQFANGTDAMEIWLFPASALERFRTKYQQVEPLGDLGAGAFLYRNKSLDYVEVYLRKGSLTLEVAVKQTAGVDAKVKALAKKAMARMP